MRTQHQDAMGAHGRYPEAKGKGMIRFEVDSTA